MIQVICSECSSELDIDTTQHGSSIELRISPCSCTLARIEELEGDCYDYSKDLDKAKSQLSELEDQIYELTEKLLQLEGRH